MHPTAPPTPAPVPVQATFDELGTPLRTTDFVVVDLETTGGSAAECSITEIGAVRVRGGEVVGELQTLVRPDCPIPPSIAVLTGITDAMVAGAPRLEEVLPSFLEFARGAVLVAHNAPFDAGFLRAACRRTGHEWPAPDVVDTARLARRVLTRDETPDCRLSTLARYFRSATTPTHRALDDARATVDVLHGLLDRLGPLGVQSLEELRSFSSQVSAAQRRKRHLAEHLPHAPGVYLFRDGQGRVLYVGTSRDLRTRVRSYFTASESRSRMAEMVGLAERVDPVVCAHALEAEVRELRLIAEHAPRYNRRSRRPDRASWLKLTVEPFPRLSLVRRVLDDGAAYLGPFTSSRTAERVAAAVHEAFPLRQCTQRLSPRRRAPSCVLAELGRCGAPCEGRQTPEEYADVVARVREALLGDPEELVTALTARIRRLSDGQRYEEAAAERDRLRDAVRSAARRQRLGALTALPELVAARPVEPRRGDGATPGPVAHPAAGHRRSTTPGVAAHPTAGRRGDAAAGDRRHAATAATATTPGRPGQAGWELVVVRHGRLAGAATVPPGVHPRPVVDSLLATAEVVVPGPGPLPAATAEETECVLRWLERPGTRLVEVSGAWTSPARGAGRLRGWWEALEEGRSAARAPSEDRRGLRPVHRPARRGA